MKNTIKNETTEPQELLIEAIMDFYKKHQGYRMSQSEFVGLICALSQQLMHDI